MPSGATSAMLTQAMLFKKEPSMSRVWAMPNPNTFDCKPIGEFVRRWISGVSADPFARNSQLATYTNDLTPDTHAESHLDAVDFLETLRGGDIELDCAIFDPPYSPGQIKECYNNIGRDVTGKDTQNAALYKRVRDAIHPLVKNGGVVLSFGWNSAGMGKTRGYEIEEILLVAHGGAHNDTICLAERKIRQPDSLPFARS